MNDASRTPTPTPSTVESAAVQVKEFRRSLRRLAVMMLVVLALLVAGGTVLARFAASERTRDLYSWQVRLGLVADSRADAVAQWVGRQFAELTGLADNTSLQLYLTELSMRGGDATQITGGPTQLEYLQNLVNVIATRGGFIEPQADATLVGANVETPGVAGVAVLDGNGNVVVATPGVALGDEALKTFRKNAPRGTTTLYGPYLDARKQPMLAFVAPIYPVQGDRVPEQQIGTVFGVRPVEKQLYPLLVHPGVTEKTLETMLVAREGDTVRYLSPLRDGTAPLVKTVDASTANLDAAFAIANPGGFSAKKDYAFTDVLITGRAIPGTPWTLVTKIDRKEALAESQARLTRMIAGFVGFSLAVLAALVALWYHSVSTKAVRSSQRFRQMAQRLEGQERMLRLVTDSQPGALVIVDKESRYHFANRAAAKEAGIEPAAMLGKTMGNVLGTGRASRYQTFSQEALTSGSPVTHVWRDTTGGTTRVFKAEHIPLANIPLPLAEANTPGVLIVEQDISEAMLEREKRERILKEMVQSLVGMVDRRDPHAAHHSQRVAHVAGAVAREMNLDTVTIDTAETAGRLMNIGKLYVPLDVLTKSGPLSDSEQATLRESMQESARMLEGIEFDGPVGETLRQAQEHWDGSGPLGLAGEKILPSARIIAVANAFVGMVSPRAYREGIAIDAALKKLMDDIDKRFERAAVAALVSYFDNKGGRAAWEELVKVSEQEAA